MAIKYISKIAAAAATAILLNAFAGVSAMADYRNTQGTSNDNGDGTYLNPVMNTDVADPDVICAPSPDGSEAYYMVSTAMQYSPGCPIMKSTDLVNWETINYLYDTLDYNNDALAMRNGKQAYGQGQWATSLRYNETNKTFYILTFSYTTNTTQVYTSKDIENGPWKKSEFKCFHDPSIFIDTDNRIYVFYGQNSLYCKELIEEDGYLYIKQEDDDPNNTGVNIVPDMTKFEVPDCIYSDAKAPSDFIIGGEGTHAYKIDGRYYLISITWPSGQVWPGKNEYWKRGEVCYRSIPDENGEHHVYGPYEGMLIMNETTDYDGYVGGGGPGQGGMTNAIGGSNRSSNGKWYGIIFQDRGAVGRCPHLVNVDWNTPGYEGWPMMSVSETGAIPSESGIRSSKKSLVKSDEFNNGTKINHAEVIPNESAAMTAASEDGETFRIKYAYNDTTDTPQSMEITTGKVQPGKWTRLNGLLMTANSVKYGHLEITCDNPALNFYIDDASVTDAGGAEYINNGEMSGQTDSSPWWWGSTSIWDNASSSNIDNAKAVTSSEQYHSAAPSLYVYDRETAEAGAMQYLNDGNDIAAESIYNVSVWVRFESGDTSDKDPSVTPAPPPKDGEELIVNGGFETGELAPWSARYSNGTTVTISNDAASGHCSAYTSGRTSTGDGPKYDLTGYIEARREYILSSKVRYDEGPAEKTFNLTLEHVNENGETGWSVLGSVTLKRGEWGEINATKMIDTDIGTVRNNIYFETPYNPAPSASDDLMDFYIDDVSVIKLPARVWEEIESGENEYNGSNLDLVWQWNHNPDNRNWSLTAREGYLRLTTGKVVENIQQARNTLTQRTFGPVCSGWTSLDTSGMKDGDYAGLAAFAARYGFVGVKQSGGKRYIVYVDTDGTPSDCDMMMKVVPNERNIVELRDDVVYFKTEYTFAGNRTNDTVSFYYSTDGINWTFVNKMTNLEYSMLHFTGYKFALFNFATEETGGYVDFDYFRIDDRLTGEGGSPSASMRIIGKTDEAVTFAVSVVNPTFRNLKVYAAAYDSDGVLHAVESKEISETAEFEFALDVSGLNSDYKVKFFVWDGMEPVTAVGVPDNTLEVMGNQ